jgi:frataxin-like iron-binding protein CyaY
MGFTYVIQNNALVITDMQGQQYTIPCVIQNNVLTITINNQAYNLVKYQGPLPQQGQPGFGG